MTCVTFATLVFSDQEVVVVRGTLELAADVDDDQVMPRVLDLAIGEPALAKQLGPAHLEVDEVVRVMEQTHPVGLGVADADRQLVLWIMVVLVARGVELAHSQKTHRRGHRDTEEVYIQGFLSF